jgi:hypothetical protein
MVDLPEHKISARTALDYRANMKSTDAISTVIPGLTRDPVTLADWIPAFAGMTDPSL